MTKAVKLVAERKLTIAELLDAEVRFCLDEMRADREREKDERIFSTPQRIQALSMIARVMIAQANIARRSDPAGSGDTIRKYAASFGAADQRKNRARPAHVGTVFEDPGDDDSDAAEFLTE